MSGSRSLPPRWPPQCSCVVIESSFDPGERLQAPGSFGDLFFLCLHISLYASNHFSHCIKLFALCGTLIDNKRNLILILLVKESIKKSSHHKIIVFILFLYIFINTLFI